MKKTDSFKDLFQNKTVAMVFVFSLALVFLFFGFTRSFLSFNEARTGGVLYDPLISYFSPIDLSTYTFGITYFCIILGLSFNMCTPEKAILTQFSIVSLLILRMICLFIVPLEPPATIIPLDDKFLTNTFYNNKILVKDLFFSGHTGSIVLMYFLVDNKYVAKILLIGSMIVGSFLIAQHVHYTLDVVCAYFFAWFGTQIGRAMKDYAFVYARYVGMYWKFA